MRLKILVTVSLAFFVLGLISTFSGNKKGWQSDHVTTKKVLSDTTGGDNSGSGSAGNSPTPTPTEYDTTTTSGDNSIDTPTPTATADVTFTTPTPATTQYDTTTDTTTYNYPSPTPTFTPTYFDETTQDYQNETQSTDRFASVDSATMSCIKSRLTSDEFEKLRYFVPQTSAEQDELANLKDKVKICFETYQETAKIGEATTKMTTLPEEVSSCLIQAVGKQAFEEINSGAREPTKEEKLKGEMCFQNQYRSTVVYQAQDESLETETDSCLLLALGRERYDAIKAGSAVTLTERQKTERCFGVSIHPLQKEPAYKLSSEVDRCLKDALGEEEYEKSATGRYIPSESSKDKANTCFDNINSIQKSVLPPPPVQIAFMKENAKKVEVNSVKRSSKKVGTNMTETRLTLTGKGPANSLIDIYIFSEPIVVVTQTDENGDWVYELTDPLTEGSHVVYASVAQSGGERVRSSVFNIDVLASDNQTSTLLPENLTTKEPNRFLRYAVLLIAFSVIVVGIAGFYLYKTLKATKSAGRTLESTDRNSKSETGPGTVN